MRKIFQKMLTGLSIIFVFFMIQAGPAFGGYSISIMNDLDKWDKNRITFQRPAGTSGMLVRERLAEPGEVALTSVPQLANKPHYAPVADSLSLTVNKNGEFFDSIVTTAFYLNPNENLIINWEFIVKSRLHKDPGIVGYGFEFYNTDFTGIDENINITWAESSVFTDCEFEDGLLDFYDPTFKNYVDYNERVKFNFTMEISGLDDGFGITKFGVRQYAIVPVPGAIWLFGSGLLGIVGYKRRKF